MLRTLFLMSLITALVFVSCGQGQQDKLQQGTPEYNLADSLSRMIPILDPDQNATLVSTSSFEVSTGAVIQRLYFNYGPRVEQLKQMQESQVRSIIRRTAEQLGEQRLLVNAARDSGIRIDTTQIDSVLQLQYQRVGSKENFLKNLEQNNIALQDVRNELRDELMIQEYLDRELGDRVTVTEEEIEAAYQEDKTTTVRHILFSTQGESESAKAATKDTAQQVLEMVHAGEDFADLARKYTDDPGSRENGGLYEDIEHGQMVKPFEDVAFSLPEDSISGLVETQFGYHIIKVLDRESETQPLDSVRTDISDRLEQQKKRDLFEKHLEQLKEEAEYELTEF